MPRCTLSPAATRLRALDLNVLIGPAQVMEIYGRDQITAADLESAGIAPGTERILIKTDNTRLARMGDGVFHEDYVGIAPSGAQWLVTHGVRLIGVDYLSVGPYGPVNVETHRILLGAGLVVVETLVLRRHSRASTRWSPCRRSLRVWKAAPAAPC